MQLEVCNAVFDTDPAGLHDQFCVLWSKIKLSGFPSGKKLLKVDTRGY